MRAAPTANVYNIVRAYTSMKVGTVRSFYAVNCPIAIYKSIVMVTNNPNKNVKRDPFRNTVDNGIEQMIRHFDFYFLCRTKQVKTF